MFGTTTKKPRLARSKRIRKRDHAQPVVGLRAQSALLAASASHLSHLEIGDRHEVCTMQIDWRRANVLVECMSPRRDDGPILLTSWGISGAGHELFTSWIACAIVVRSVRHGANPKICGKMIVLKEPPRPNRNSQSMTCSRLERLRKSCAGFADDCRTIDTCQC